MRFGAASLLALVPERWRSMYDECGLSTCRNTVFLRNIQSRAGVTVGERWYCSVDCFVASMRKRYSALSATKVVDIRHVPRRSIGLLLLAKGVLTEDQLRIATAESKASGESLEHTLSRTGIPTDQQIATAKAAQWGCAVLGQDQPILDVQADIPRTLLRGCSAVPLHYSTSTKRLVVGFFQQIDHSFLASLEEVTGMRPEVCFITHSQFSEQLTRLSNTSRWEEVFLEDNCTPAQMANTTGRFAIKLGARDARFARCQNLLWTRLTGKRGVVDLLYRIRNARPMLSPGDASLYEEVSSLRDRESSAGCR